MLAGADAPTRYRFILTPPAGTPLSAKRLRSGAWVLLSPGHVGPSFELAPPLVDEAAAASDSRLPGGEAEGCGGPGRQACGGEVRG